MDKDNSCEYNILFKFSYHSTDFEHVSMKNLKFDYSSHSIECFMKVFTINEIQTEISLLLKTILGQFSRTSIVSKQIWKIKNVNHQRSFVVDRYQE